MSSKEDRFGNQIRYQYGSNGNMYYPLKITYGGYEVSFLYAYKRELTKVGYKGGKAYLKQLVLVAIETRVAGQEAAHRYLLNYSALNYRSYSTQLDSIRYCDADYNCTPATKFKWQEQIQVESAPISISNLLDKGAGTPLFFDFNKDGEQDVCIQTKTSFACATGPEFSNWDIKKFLFVLTENFVGGPDVSSGFQIVDLQNDGFPEVCFEKGVKGDILCFKR
ncbi:hypothetical protein THIOSC13_1470009 [uncultured Thiomicrorhabdus sp.]